MIPRPSARFLVLVVMLWGFALGNLRAQATQDTSAFWRFIEASKDREKVNYAESKAYADSALKLAERLVYERGIVTAHRQLGLAALNNGDYKEADHHMTLAKDYYLRKGDTLNVAKMLNNLGIVQRDMGQFEQAMEYHMEAIRLSEMVDHLSGVASNYLNIGVIFGIKNDIPQALSYFKKASATYVELQDSSRLATIQLNIAGAQKDLGRLDSAQATVESILPYIRRKGLTSEEGRGEYLLGVLLLEVGDLDGAERHLLISRSIFEGLGSVMRVTGNLLRLSELYLQRGQAAKAKALAEEALVNGRALPSKNLIMQSLAQLSAVEEALGNYKAALEYHKEFKLRSDSLENAESSAKLAELDKRYQSEVQERQLANLTAQNAVSALEIRKQKVEKRILMAIAVGALLLFGFIVVQVRAKQRTNQLLREKNAIIEKNLEDREVLLREIHHRVKNNLQFISSLFSLQARHVNDEAALQALREGKERIGTIALVHHKLYQENNLTGVDMADYLDSLVKHLMGAFGMDGNRLLLDLRCDPLRLDVDSAMPLGLMVNELVTNAFKYGLKDVHDPVLWVELKRDGERLHLVVKDNGAGFPEAFNPEASTGFGFHLMQSLSKKLGATLQVSNHPGGKVECTITKFKTA
jgi:two-component sensor histidine kinase